MSNGLLFALFLGAVWLVIIGLALASMSWLTRKGPGPHNE